MATTKLISLNVRGLHAAGKRHSLYRELLRMQGDIIFLQETHLTYTTSVKLYAHQYPIWYYSLSDISKAKGVAIGFRRGTSFIVDDFLADPSGRFLFIRGSLGDFSCTLANLYAPNQGQANFMAATLTKLQNFARECIILRGHLNIPLEPILDTSQGKSCIPHRRLAYIRKLLHNTQLMDVWRIMHPGAKDYTHYSHVYESHSRIDYLYIQHHFLDLLVRSSIEISTISDHSPISMLFHSPSIPMKSTNWKMNDSLLTDEIDVKEIEKSLSLYFRDNISPDISPGTLWEAHKALIRGKLIELGARKKRERTHLQSTFIKETGNFALPH